MTRVESLEARARLAVAAQQEAARLRDSGRLAWVADDHGCPEVLRLAALMEEVGEVARAVHDGDHGSLNAELSQVAGIALAWGVDVESRIA